MTVEELVERYLSTRIGVKPNTKANYNFVKNLMKKEDFYYKKIGDVKTSDAKLFLIKLQQDGKRYSTVKTVRGVLRPAFQMAVDDDVLHKNPFGFELAGVVVNDSVTREALTRDQMRKFLKFVHDDNVYCKYSIGSWRNNWTQLSTYFKYPSEIRKLIYTTNSIENFNRQLRKVTKSKTIFPTDDALFKMLYLAMMDATKKWTGKAWDWGLTLDQLCIYFGDRIQPEDID